MTITKARLEELKTMRQTPVTHLTYTMDGSIAHALNQNQHNALERKIAEYEKEFSIQRQNFKAQTVFAAHQGLAKTQFNTHTIKQEITP